jgi:hypothetical protein
MQKRMRNTRRVVHFIEGRGIHMGLKRIYLGKISIINESCLSIGEGKILKHHIISKSDRRG